MGPQGAGLSAEQVYRGRDNTPGGAVCHRLGPVVLAEHTDGGAVDLEAKSSTRLCRTTADSANKYTPQ